MSSSRSASCSFGLVVAAALLVSGSARTDQKIARAGVPAPVLAAFGKAYPKATVRSYEFDRVNGVTIYQIESVEGGLAREATYKPDGTAIEIREAVPPRALPPSVTKVVDTLKPKATIRRAQRVTRGDWVQYQVSLLQGTKKSRLVCDATGTSTR